MIIKPITYIIILVASVLFWSGLSSSSIKTETLAKMGGAIYKTKQQPDTIAIASTHHANRKQTEIRKAENPGYPFKRTFFKVIKNIFSPDKRLPKRSFFRNILKR